MDGTRVYYAKRNKSVRERKISFDLTHMRNLRHRQREKQAPCREPDVGLDPGTPGSQPEPNADVQPLSHTGVPTQKYS